MALLRMKGLYFEQLAKHSRAESLKDDIKFFKDNMRKAGKFYLQSADVYPDDDEEHACAYAY